MRAFLAMLRPPPADQEAPAVPAPVPAARVPDQRPALAPAPARSILVVDDDADIRETLHLFLAKQGWTVHSVDSAEAALEVLRQSRFDVVLTDQRMAGMDGAELLARLREEAPGTRGVLMSAYAESFIPREQQAVGGYVFLPKPLDLRRLRAVLGDPRPSAD